MKIALLAAAAALLVATSHAQAVSCARPGLINVHKADGGYVFYVSKAYGDAAFMIPGKAFTSMPDAAPGSAMFTVDQVDYQFLAVPKEKYVSKAAKSNTDDTILARHARQEHQFAVNTGAAFTSFDDLGNRARVAEGATPALVFKMWTLRDPRQPAGASQYMLSTVVGNEVAVLSATVPSQAHEAGALAVFERYSASYQFLKSQKECPATKAPER